MSKVITILGGNGYVGRRCISAVLDLGENVRVNVISRSGIISSGKVYKFDTNVKFFKGDCLKPEDFQNIIDESTGIIHSIGGLLTTKPDSDPGSYNMLNKESCLRVAKLANLSGKKNFVYISSAAGLPFPLSLKFGGYIKTKRETEVELVKLTNLNSVILRPGFVIDAKDRPASIPVQYPVNFLNFLDENLVKKFLPSLSNALTLPAKSTQLEILAGYSAAGALGKLKGRIYSNEEMIENFKNLNRE
jgi:nucleoside-diphosphate-sugar epimerase